jgi:pimeloyl-ACP methyl ester carboxylesterase
MKVVLLHGFGETSDVWKSFVGLLSSSYEYLPFDYSKLTFCQSVEEYADWLHTEIEERKLTELVLIGHSMGGYIALAYAEKYGHFLKGLGLFHSTATEDSPEKKESRDKTVLFLEKHGVAPFIKDFLPKMYNETFLKQNQAHLKSQLSDNYQLPVEALITATKAIKNRPDRREVLEKLQVPTLMIIGKQDPFIDYPIALSQISLLKKPYILIVNEIAHAGMVESPGVCAHTVNQFLENCETTMV